MQKSARNIFHDYLSHDLKVSPETGDRFDVYFNLLVKWQKRINLISNPHDIWVRHFLDSVQLATIITDKDASIIDLGSGAGLPSMALAILGYNNIEAIESDTKKCVFLKEAARETSSKIQITNERIESLKRQGVDIITARACTGLQSLLKYSFPFVSHGTTCLFLKGKKYAMEVDAAKQDWFFDCKVIPSITSEDGAILSITNLKRRDDHGKNKNFTSGPKET